MGLADFVLALALCGMLLPGTFHILDTAEGLIAMFRFPLIFITAFAMPVAFGIHLLSFRLLARHSRAVDEPTAK